jgi:hypothetical protein
MLCAHDRPGQFLQELTIEEGVKIGRRSKCGWEEVIGEGWIGVWRSNVRGVDRSFRMLDLSAFGT